MSLIMDVAECVANALMDYAQRSEWSGRKIFGLVFAVWFLPMALHVVLAPSAKGIGIGMSLAAAHGSAMGLVAVAGSTCARRRRQKKSAAQS